MRYHKKPCSEQYIIPLCGCSTYVHCNEINVTCSAFSKYYLKTFAVLNMLVDDTFFSSLFYLNLPLLNKLILNISKISRLEKQSSSSITFFL